LLWRPVGGAVEAEVRSAWRCSADLVLSDGGAPWSSAVEIPPFLKPSPAMVWRPGRFLFNKEEAACWSPAMEMEGRGVSSSELATGDFPFAEGLHLVQVIKRCGDGGAPPAASSSSSTSGSGGPYCNFLFVLDRSVRTGLLI
jgi:hypothetical protein